jgi:LmbE family N-acetylglucosaminyl deacetylase
MTTRRLLISYAHPDDESFGLGGLISKYVDESVEVYLICATNGDVGTVSPEMMNGYKTITELRLAELACAAEKLGLKQVFTLGYKDSGMMGNPDNNDPDCLWAVYNNNPDDIERRVVEVIRTIKPQVIITFNAYGGYGHPDHIAIQRATTKAFDLANDDSYIISDLSPYRPQKLYYSSIPTFFIKLGIWISRLKGENPRKLGRNHDMDLVAILDHVQPTHTRIDISKYIDAWDAASACHASQGGGMRGIFPRWLRRILGIKQTFTRIHPQPLHDGTDETDLFEYVTFDTVSVEHIS